MKRYSHTQFGTVIVVSIFAALVFAVVMLVNTGAYQQPIAALTLVLLPLMAWLFYSLTIEVTDDRLKWRFGPGLIRKSVPLAQIAHAEPVRTNVLEGWGIHISRFGWLYNVSGWTAVAITLHNGKRFALGTDDPAHLIESLRLAGSQSSTRS